MLQEIIFALELTMMVELLIYGFMDSFNFKSFIAMYVTNIILNLSMNITLYYIKDYSTYLTLLIIFEISVFVIEGFIYYLFTKKRLWYCFLASFTANICSFALGYLFNYYNIPHNQMWFFILTSIFVVLFSIELAYSLFLFIKEKIQL